MFSCTVEGKPHHFALILPLDTPTGNVKKKDKLLHFHLAHRGGGGIYYTHVVHGLNNEFMEDKHVVLYGWLSLQKSLRCQPSTTLFQGVNHTKR
jgi:hypothetical protein